MSSNGQGQGGPPDGGGPPDHAGPPERVRKKFRSAKRSDSGEIQVSDDPLADLAANVDWDNLSAFEEYVLAVLESEGMI